MMRRRGSVGQRAVPQPRWHHRLRGVSAGIAVASLLGCKTGPDLSADYAQTARENYELASGEFADDDWDEAIQYADFVRIRFPFSRYAVEAELLIARAEFEQGNYLTAQDAFRQFAKLHPTHKHARNGWVAYMAAAAAYMNGPQRSFLVPPKFQRDQSQFEEALVELEFFFDHYGDTEVARFAIELRDEIKRRLLEHELYVADYYLTRDKAEAAIGRLEAAHAQYPGIGLDAEVLFQLGVTYLRLDEIELARSTFAELQAQHPDHHRGKQARSFYLPHIHETYGPSDPQRKRPDRSPPVPVAPPLPRYKAQPERPDRAIAGESDPPRATPVAPEGRRNVPGGATSGGAKTGGAPPSEAPPGDAPSGDTKPPETKPPEPPPKGTAGTQPPAETPQP